MKYFYKSFLIGIFCVAWVMLSIYIIYTTWNIDNLLVKMFGIAQLVLSLCGSYAGIIAAQNEFRKYLDQQ
jgi:uncharacterized membrane protein (DUF485 family)